MSLFRQAGVVMLPLLAASIVMLAIIIDRLLVFAGRMKIPPAADENPSRVINELQRGMIALHTIITISPMLGLLGTVTGLIKCFHLLGAGDRGYDPQTVSVGISEALLTTAAGLIIAVIATIFYNYFTYRLEAYVQHYNTGGRETP